MLNTIDMAIPRVVCYTEYVLVADTYETIQITRPAPGVALATLNRPERLNAVDGTLHHELTRLPREFDADTEAKALVITGAGRGFCAGGDFQAGGFETGNDLAVIDAGRMIVDHILECRKPIISAVNGYAMGLGASLALLCDVVIAARSAVIADTHILMGAGAGDGGQVIWPLLMGVNRAKYFLMTGDRLDAEEAERLGLVNFVVDDDKVVDRAIEIAVRLTALSPSAVMASKVPINNWIRIQSAQILPLSLAMESASIQSPDFRKVQAAFQEQRAARNKDS